METILCLNHLEHKPCRSGCPRAHARSAELYAEFLRKQPVPAALCPLADRCPRPDRCPRLHFAGKLPLGRQTPGSRPTGARSRRKGPRPAERKPSASPDRPEVKVQILQRGQAGTPGPAPAENDPLAGTRAALTNLRQAAAQMEVVLRSLEALQRPIRELGDAGLAERCARIAEQMADIVAPSAAILADIQACRSQVARPATPDRKLPAAGEKTLPRSASVASETPSTGSTGSTVSTAPSGAGARRSGRTPSVASEAPSTTSSGTASSRASGRAVPSVSSSPPRRAGRSGTDGAGGAPRASAATGPSARGREAPRAPSPLPSARQTWADMLGDD